jgi:hypothetical protein
MREPMALRRFLIQTTFAFALSINAQNPGQTLKPVKVIELQAKTAHVQGIDTDGVHLWVTSVDRPNRKGYLQEFSVQGGRLERTIEIQDGDRFHAGGMAADRDSIWIPVAEYRAQSSAVIERRNKKTFALEFQFVVADHIGCVVATREFIIGANWDARDFYFWDRKGKLIRKVTSSTANAYQDLKLRGDTIVASGLLAGRQGAVDWLEIPSMNLMRRVAVGNTDKGEPLTREGMTIFGKQLWFLPEDGASRLFMFELHDN